MTIAVDLGRKATKQINKINEFNLGIFNIFSSTGVTSGFHQYNGVGSQGLSPFSIFISFFSSPEL